MSLLEQLRKKHHSQPEVFPTRWKPEGPGDGLEARFVRVDEFEAGYGPSKAIILEKDGVEYSVIANTSLMAAFEDLDASPGDEVALMYVGERTSKAGRVWKKWDAVKADDLLIAPVEFAPPLPEGAVAAPLNRKPPTGA